ncbi:MAG TPA: sugar transferase [Actinotalea sp.]
MTLAVEPGFDWPSRRDRRATSRETRRSWASAQPFELRPTTYNNAAALSQRWTTVAHAYRRRAVVLDAFATVLVAAPLLVSIYGSSLGAALTVVGTLCFLAVIALARGYETKQMGDGPGEYQALLRAGVWTGGLLMAASYIFQAEVSRALVFGGIPLVILATVTGRHAHRRLLHDARADGHAMLRTLVVGDPSSIGRVVTDLASAPYHGYDVTGVCVPSVEEVSAVQDVPVVGAVADIPQVVADRAIDVVVVAGSHLSGEALRRLSWALDRVGAQLMVVPDLVEVTGPRLTVRPAAGLSLLEVEIGATRSRLLVKAVLDRAIGSLMLLAATPIILLGALAVRLTSRGKAFYRQTRVGVDGSTFTMWKLRSMYVDAEERRAALEADGGAAGVLFKMRRDPRVTPVGRVLRRYSLDELPQLLNVVKGDMSLVGPRPPLAEEVAVYADAVHRRLRVKPGLTGLWQVSGRSDLSWDESVRLDLRYVDNWSVAMDLMILWKTGRAVVLGTGAY